MANEVQVFEMIGERPLTGGAMPTNFRAKQTLSIGGAASSAFNAGTSWVAVVSTTGCVVEFGATPDGLGITFPIVAGRVYHFAAHHGLKIIAAAGTATAPATTTTAGASENHIGEVGSPIANVQVTPTLDTSQYASGDVLFDTTAIAGAVRTSGGKALLQSLCVVDKDDQKPAFNLVFLRANQSLGTFNVAPDIDDTEVLDVCGIVEVVAGDYKDLGGASVASIKNLGLIVGATTGTTVYVAAYLTAGTPTHTASGLKLTFGLLQA